jgi:uncharacterized membrane protein
MRPKQPINVTATSPSELSALGRFHPNGRKVPASHGVDWYENAWTLLMRAPWQGLVVLLAIFFANLLILGIGLSPFGNLSIALSVLVSLVSYLGFISLMPLVCAHLIMYRGINIRKLLGEICTRHVWSVLKMFLLGIAMGLAIFVFALGVHYAVFGDSWLSWANNDFFTYRGLMPDRGELSALLAILFVLILLFIPLLLMFLFLVMSLPLVMINGYPAFKAMRICFRATVINTPAYLVNALVSAILILVCTILPVLGHMILLPISLLLAFTAYHDIFYSQD